jgi:hypothetical protein
LDKALGLATGLIRNDLYKLDHPIRLEELPEVILGDGHGEIPDKDPHGQALPVVGCSKSRTHHTALAITLQRRGQGQ